MFYHIVDSVREALAKIVNPTLADKYNLIGKTLRACGCVFPAKFKFAASKHANRAILMVKPTDKDVPDLTVVVDGFRNDTETVMLFPHLNCQKAVEIDAANTDIYAVLPGQRCVSANDFKHRLISHPADHVDDIDIELVLWCIRNYGEVMVTLPQVKIVH